MACADEVYDVIVIGAGLGGLQCASSLVNEQRLDSQKVCVLEAKSSIGGRIQECKSFIPGATLALGAEYLHGTDNELYSYAEQLGCSFEVVHQWSHGSMSRGAASEGGGMLYLADSGRVLDIRDNDDQLGKLNDAICNILNLTEAELSTEPGGLKEYLSQHVESSEVLGIARAVLAAGMYSDLEDVSMAEVYKYCKAINEVDITAKILKVDPPLGSIVESLSAGLTIKCNARATKVRYAGRLAPDEDPFAPSGEALSNGLVTVETAGGDVYRCRRVVVTSSAASLQRRELEFDPGLTAAKARALMELKVVPEIKMYLKFSRCPWPSRLTGMVMSGCPIPQVSFRASLGPDPVYYCAAVCTAQYAQDLKDTSDADLIALLLHQLDASLSLMPAGAGPGGDRLPTASSVYSGGMVSVWNETTPCVGAYTIRAVDEQQASALAAPLADKVFFAGEATVGGSGLRLHDEMASGRRAAQAVGASLAAPRLTDALDRYFSQPVATVVGFGSLMSESSARATFPNLKNFRVVRVNGYRRVFGHSPSVMVQRGLASTGSMQQACLSVEPVYVQGRNSGSGSSSSSEECLDESIGFLGVCFDLSMNDMCDAIGGVVGVGGRMWCGEALMKREEEFNFDIVACRGAQKSGEADADSFPGLMCAASTDREFRLRWGAAVFDEALAKTGLPAIWDWGVDSKLAPCPTYANHCYLAAQSLGVHALNSFLDETFLVDRRTSVRAYLSRNPDVLFQQPPSIHDSRHLSDRVKKTPPRSNKLPGPAEMPFPPRLDLPRPEHDPEGAQNGGDSFIPSLALIASAAAAVGLISFFAYSRRNASR